MKLLRAALLPILLASAACATQPAPPPPSATPYYLGGAMPITPEARAILDRHADILSLGVNTDWLAASKIDAGEYVRALGIVGDAVKQGRLAGATILADRFTANTMPVAVGYQITDPQKRRLVYDQVYDVGDMTGPFLVPPLLHKAEARKLLRRDDPVARWVPELTDEAWQRLTLLDLLQHRAGLPPRIPRTAPFRSQEEFFAALNRVSPDFSREARPSPFQFMILALVVERAFRQPFGELAMKEIVEPLSLTDALLQIPPDKRVRVAPGEYSRWLRRMAWAEPEEAFGRFRGTGAGHDGLLLSADAAAGLMGGQIFASVKDGGGATPGTLAATLAAAFNPEATTVPPPDGWMTGRFGNDSFGWDSSTGSSVWVLPRRLGIVVLLANLDHPGGVQPKGRRACQEAVEALARSLGYGQPLQPLAPMAGEAPAGAK